MGFLCVVPYYKTMFRYSDRNGEPAVDEQKLEEELFEALEGPMDDATYLKRDVIFGQFNFSLKQGTVKLLSTAGMSMMELELENVVLGFESRPRNASYKITAALGAIFLKDRLTADTVFPVSFSVHNQRFD